MKLTLVVQKNTSGKMSHFLALLSLLLVFGTYGKVITKDDLFEGDILLTQNSKKLVDGDISFDAVISNSRKWTKAVVPYVFAYNFDSRRRQVVRQAIQDYNKYTCIRFVPRTNQRNYVRFMIGGGCYSMIGMQGGRQDISIGPNCYYKGIVIHEMMHAVGFWHEQSRLDRDKYITIYWQNISPSTKYNFRKYSHGQADYYGEPYDYNSVMHYGNRAFSINGRPTIGAKGNPNRQLGQRSGFSTIDKRQLNKLYRCKGTTTGGTVKPPVKPKPKPGGSCTDSHRHCYYWSRRGHCTSSHRNWMQKNCRKSCGKCRGGGGGVRCTDKNRYCSSWARTGYCRWNAYVKRNCKKSCRFC